MKSILKNIIKKCTTMVIVMALLFTTLSISAYCDEIQQKWCKTNQEEIKSLDSEDYSDLEFLKSLLADKTVVSLGENFHRVGEYSTLKTRIIKYLHEELGFDVIAFESGMGECAAVSEDISNLTSKEMMENSIFPIWHSKETLGLFDYIKAQSKTDRPLELAGYDMQLTSMYFSNFMFKWLYGIDVDIATDFATFEMEYLQSFYGLLNQYAFESYKHKQEFQTILDKYAPKYEEVIKYMTNNREKFEAVYPDNKQLFDIAIKTLQTRPDMVKMSMLENRASYELRDVIMADNVEWMMKTLYPNKKVILWAHNDHLSKNTSEILTQENGKWINNFTSMGELLSKKLQDKMYVIGFYMNSGKATTITTMKPFDIKPMPNGSLENLMMNSGYKYTFVDLMNHEKETKEYEWMFNPIFAGEDGMTSEIIRPMSMLFVPKNQYDALILIDEVSEPTIEY